MFSWLKKHFIPHEGNVYRPHILRDVSTRNIVTIILLLEIITFLVPVFSHINFTGNMAAVLPAVLTDLTNDARQAQNLPVLKVNPLLTEAAQLKANDMATNSYFAHVSPRGLTPWYWLQQAGYNYQYAGENLAINFTDSQDVTNAWMASPTHRANIVKGNYTDIGTAVATGTYQGQQTIFVVQDFANPMPTDLKTAPLKTPIKKVAITTDTNNGKVPTEVLGAETVVNPTPQNILTNQNIKPTLWQKIIASPRNSTNTIYYIIFGIILIALLLYIIIKRTKHHFDLITNGLIVLAILGAILSTNYYITHRNMIISDSLNYSNQSL